MPEFSSFFTFFLHGCLCIWIFHCLRHRNEFVNKTNMSYRIRLLCSDVILMSFCVPSSLGLVLSSALAFSNIAVDSHPLLLIGILQSIAAGIGTSNFLRAAFIMCLNSSSSGSMKYILLNCLALSIFDFSMAHFCFAFFFAASDICLHISGHISSGREVDCFLASLSTQQVYPSGGLSFNRTNLVNPVHASDNFHSPSTFPVIFNIFSTNTSRDVYVVLAPSMHFNGIGE